MFRCAGCNSESRDVAQCSACSRCFDFNCAGITEVGYRKLGDRKSNWKCLGCKAGTQNVGQHALLSSPSVTKTTDLDSMHSELKKMSKRMSILDTLAEDMKSIKAEIQDLKSSVDYAHETVKAFSDKFSDMETRLELLENDRSELFSLKKRVEQMESTLKDNEQRARLNNIEIKGIPQKNSENLLDIVTKIGTVVNCNISNSQINYISRIPTRNDKKQDSKPIIVSFNNRYIRDNFVASARSHKSLTPKDLQLQGDGRIFINDHLTLDNKLLLNKTKMLAKEKGFMYVWVKYSKIWIRKNSESRAFLIKSELDLLKITN